MNITKFIKNMKMSWLVILIFVVYGCNSTSGVSLQNPSGCPSQPGTLETENVREITISEDKVTQESGMLQAGNDVGYVFEGQAGQRLNYQTKDDICLWLFNVDNKILNGTTLPESGTYTLQVAVVRGSTTFNLDLSFGELQASSPSNPNPPQPPGLPSSQSSPTSSFTKDQAVDLVGRWLDAKAQVFGPNYDSRPASELLTGGRLSDALQSINTLRRENAHYEYVSNNVVPVSDLSVSDDYAVLDVLITEDMKFYVNGTLSSRYTTYGPRQTRYRIEFRLDRGVWKIENIEKI